MVSARAVSFFVLIFVLGGNVIALSREFAIENRVLSGEQVVNETRTIITDKAYYDVILDERQKPVKVSIYLPEQRKFQVIDFRSKQQATIGELDVRQFVANLELRAADHGEIVNFAAHPTFKLRSPNGDRLRLENPIWTYQTELDKERDEELVDSYRRFADAFARLNAFWSLPPNARLKLNEAIHAKQAVPRKVEVVIVPRKGQTLRQQTEHRYSAGLTPIDRKAIASAEKAIRDFQEVPFDKFLTTMLTAKSNKTRR